MLLFASQNFHVGGWERENTTVISDCVHFFIEAENFRSVMIYLFQKCGFIVACASGFF